MDSVASREAAQGRGKASWLLRAWLLAGRYKFSCFLSEQPSGPIPRRALPGLNAPSDDAERVVNASFRHQPGTELPDEIRESALALNACLRGFPIAWVKDPGTDVWMPFWARGEYAEALESLRPGLPAPSGLPAGVQRALALANILVPRGYEEARRTRWEQTVEAARMPFRTRGHAIVRDLIHPLQLGALRQYYRTLLAGGEVPIGDWLADRYGLHSEMMASFLHSQLAALVSRIADEPVKPSFVYLGSYRPGAVLPRHRDRPQCEFSISLLIDYMPDPDGPCGWPLYLENPRTPDSTIGADLGLGDGAFYRGREVFHYRDALPKGHQATLLFLNYVCEDFTGRLW
jgi:hypothetical protein